MNKWLDEGTQEGEKERTNEPTKEWFNQCDKVRTNKRMNV